MPPPCTVNCDDPVAGRFALCIICVNTAPTEYPIVKLPTRRPTLNNTRKLLATLPPA